MTGPIHRNNYGFTLIEIIAVLLLMSIIAATVLGRAINTEQIDLAAQTDNIRNHFRYAHSMSMKYGDTVWGIRCANIAGQNEYWIFRLSVPVGDPVNDPNLPENQVRLPGETELTVNLTEKGVTMGLFTIFFDAYGRPYDSYTDETSTPRTTPKNITVVVGVHTRLLTITPETGFIR